MKKYKFQIIFLICILYSGRIFSFKYEWQKKNELNSVQIWEEILKTRKDYKLLIAEDFEQELLWEDGSKLSYSTQLNIISNIPNEPAYDLEQNLATQYAKKVPGNFSLSVLTHFSNLGREYFFLKAQKKIQLYGYLKRFSVWVYSKNYKHRLYLQMFDTYNRKHLLSLGTLNFEGWKRLEISLPPAFSLRNKRSNQPYKNELSGFVIKSSRFEKRQSCYLIIDHLAFLVDRSKWTYPGSKIQDNWGEFEGKNRIK